MFELLKKYCTSCSRAVSVLHGIRQHQRDNPDRDYSDTDMGSQRGGNFEYRFRISNGKRSIHIRTRDFIFDYVVHDDYPQGVILFDHSDGYSRVDITDERGSFILSDTHENALIEYPMLPEEAFQYSTVLELPSPEVIEYFMNRPYEGCITAELTVFNTDWLGACEAFTESEEFRTALRGIIMVQGAYCITQGIKI